MIPRRVPSYPPFLLVSSRTRFFSSSSSAKQAPFRREWFNDAKPGCGHGNRELSQTRDKSKLQTNNRDTSPHAAYKTQQNTVSSDHGTAEQAPHKDTEYRILQLKHDVDRNYPITLHRIELLMTHPLLSPHQVLQLCDIARSAGICSGSLYTLALDTLSRAPSYMRAGRYMEKVLNLMFSDGIAPSIRSYIANMREWSRTGGVDRAQSLMQDMNKNGVSMSTAAFNILFTHRSKLGHLDQCMDLYKMMKEKGITPNTTTLVILMEGFCAFGGLHYAIKMFENFKEDGYTPSSDLCNVLMKQIAELGSVTQLEFLFNQMRRGETIRPNLETYSYMIEAYKKENKKNKVEEMEELMKQDAYLPDIVEIGSKLINLGKTGYHMQIEKMIRILHRLGISLTIDCYNAMIYAYTHAQGYKQRAKALTAYTKLKAQGLEANLDTFIPLMTIYFKNCDWLNVKLTYNDICNYINKTDKYPEGKEANKKPIPTAVYSMLISTYLEMGEHEQARTLINTLEKENTPIDSTVYEAFITALGFIESKGDEGTRGGSETVAEVAQVVECMQEKGLEPSINVYSELINNLINQNKTDKAVEVLEALYTKKQHLDVELFTPPIREYCSNEEPEKAMKVVELMKKGEVLPNEYLVTSLVFCLVRAKQFNTAWDVVGWGKMAGMDIIGFGDIIQNAQKKVTL
eukprot:Phypoly_transcript_04695.p1 GENE.Phypoly_transcript_04695~~Phypoly_transcript_04695.p1  ORF type:complete len:686 (+),score=97.18 Phypoly_transcript_04695:63-2120(+)